MTSPQPRYSKEEHARRGTALYEQKVRPQVEAGNHGKVVALDVDSGAFEVAEDTLAASQRLVQRLPFAQIWCVRIGYPAVHRFGPRVRAGATMMTGIVNWAGYHVLPKVRELSDRRETMVKTFTAKYTKIPSGYMGQLVEWPEVITEGKNLEECRELLVDAVKEMIAAYQQQEKEIPLGGALIEQLAVET
jgi:predicted RNase H-like HicB family nuclease